MIKKLSNKQYDQYTASDLREFWCHYFQTVHRDTYNSGFVGNDLKRLKELVQEADVYWILYTMILAIDEGCKNLKFYFEDYSGIIVENPKEKFFVKIHGDKEQKQLLFQLVLLESKWFLSVSDVQKKQDILKQLRDWIDIKYGKF